MEYPEKYFKLIDFFLKKRDPAQGGVDGFYNPFSFNLSEINEVEWDISKEELIKMLKQMEREMVEINSQEKKLMDPYEVNGDSITINNLTTEKLLKFKENIINHAQRPRIVKIEFTNDGKLIDAHNNRVIHSYRERPMAYDICNYLFNDALRGEWVNWDQIADHIDGIPGEHETAKKTIYDSVRGINKHIQNKINQKIIENNGRDKYRVIN